MIKPLKFVGGSKRDLSDFPEEVRQELGHALFVAQEGGRAPTVKTLRGFSGSSVVEIVEDHDGDAYRCVYTTKIDDVVVVLHAFQKKSKRGSETPKHDVDRVHARLKLALAREWN
jgi:phage-related protein